MLCISELLRVPALVVNRFVIPFSLKEKPTSSSDSAKFPVMKTEFPTSVFEKPKLTLSPSSRSVSVNSFQESKVVLLNSIVNDLMKSRVNVSSPGTSDSPTFFVILSSGSATQITVLPFLTSTLITLASSMSFFSRYVSETSKVLLTLIKSVWSPETTNEFAISDELEKEWVSVCTETNLVSSSRPELKVTSSPEAVAVTSVSSMKYLLLPVIKSAAFSMVASFAAASVTVNATCFSKAILSKVKSAIN